MRLLILTILTVGCTTVNHNNYVIKVDDQPYQYVDSQFRPMLEMFVTLAATKDIQVDTSNLSMTFGLVRSVKSDTVGTCSQDEVGVMVIKIHDESWAKMDPLQREELIFHELGHCLLDRPHCTTKVKGKPISIMHPKVIPKKHYKSNRKELINELFSVDPRCK